MEQSAAIKLPSPTLIIAEAGVNHNGDLSLALRLCDAAREAGADVVKFQTWKTEALLLPDSPLAPYQQLGGTYGSQYAMAKALELPYEDFLTIAEHCRNIGIRFLSTPDEAESLSFLTDIMNLTTIKVGSGEVTNIPFLELVGSHGVEVILSTGMSSMEETENALEVLRRSGAGPLILLHCTSQYPAPYNELNLRAIPAMASYFGIPIGYSDHTAGIEAAIAAVTLGAIVIEKHLTLNCSMVGPDHRSSAEPAVFRAMVKAIRNIEVALGDGIKRAQPSEESSRRVVQKTLVASCPIVYGESFTLANVAAMRGATGIPASDWYNVKGKVAGRNFSTYEPIILP
jgi:N,N'-diacetyllegionaminate synthase